VTKSERESIRKLFGGKCAYCGKPLTNRWHVDHVTPMFRRRPGSDERDAAAVKYPACARCNLWKKTFSVEQFRQEIKAQPARLRRDSAAFRLAEDFLGVTDEHSRPVVFWFERYVPF
jgi:hypothetical protein